MNVAESKEPEIPHWPADWPGRQLVDLDNVGDPGLWLQDQLPDPVEILFGDPDDDQKNAEELTAAYIGRLEEIGFTLPTEFEFTEEEVREAFTNEFLGFLREWRKQAVAGQGDSPESRT